MCEEECRCAYCQGGLDVSRPVKLFSGFREVLDEDNEWEDTFSNPEDIEFLKSTSEFMVTLTPEGEYRVAGRDLVLNSFELEQA